MTCGCSIHAVTSVRSPNVSQETEHIRRLSVLKENLASYNLVVRVSSEAFHDEFISWTEQPGPWKYSLLPRSPRPARCVLSLTPVPRLRTEYWFQVLAPHPLTQPLIVKCHACLASLTKLDVSFKENMQQVCPFPPLRVGCTAKMIQEEQRLIDGLWGESYSNSTPFVILLLLLCRFPSLR